MVVVALLLMTPQRPDATALYRRTSASVLRVLTDTGSGTGFVVGDGTLILTCDHVVDDATWISVGNGIRCRLVFRDPESDIAVLRAPKRIANPLKLLVGSAPAPGSPVYVIGNPLGVYQSTITDGMVGGLRRRGNLALLQISAPISAGSSGSPVLTSAGVVVGMARSSVDEDGAQNFNFAVSAYNLRQAMSAAKVSRVAKSPTRPGPKKRVVLGKLGQALTKTPIRERPDHGSPIFYTALKKDYLVLVREESGWFKILMQTGNYGYAPVSAIQQLPYDVTSDVATKTPRAADIAKNPFGEAVAKHAKTMVGSSYRVPTAEQPSGDGSSEFIAKVFALAEKSLVKDISSQSKLGEAVYRLEKLRAGDRLYFKGAETDAPEHAGIFLGDGNFVHYTAGGVVQESLSNEKWLKILVGARR